MPVESKLFSEYDVVMRGREGFMRGREGFMRARGGFMLAERAVPEIYERFICSSTACNLPSIVDFLSRRSSMRMFVATR